MLILNLLQADSGIFKTLAYLGTHIQAYSQSYILGYIYRRILSHIPVYFSRFRHIQDPCITDHNNINQHLLFNPGSSFKSLFKLWNIFSFFFSRVDIQHFALQDSISIIAITIIETCHPRYYATHPPTVACHPHKHTTNPTHATHTPHVTHANHASTLLA